MCKHDDFARIKKMEKVTKQIGFCFMGSREMNAERKWQTDSL
jgi:hypothetical protein